MTTEAIADLAEAVDAAVDGNQDARLLARSPNGSFFGAVPPDCRRLLRVASVLGREFGIGMLAAVAGDTPAAVLGGLEPALASGLVVTCEGYQLRFAHPLALEAAYAQVPAMERQRLHLRVADVMEAQAGESADVLAYHLRRAVPLGDARRALDMTLCAARHAWRRMAYEQAVDQYREALGLLSVVGARPVRRQDLLLELARCEFRAGAVTAAWQSCLRAADLGRATEDGATIADAATVLRGLTDDPVCEEIHSLCREALPLLRDDPARRSRVLAQLAITASPWDESELDAHPLRDGEATGDLDAQSLALQARQIALANPEHVLDRVANAGHAVQLGHEVGSDELVADGHAWRMDSYWELGRRISFDAELAAFADVAAHRKQPLCLWRLRMRRASVALAEGRFEVAAGHADQARAGLRGGYQGAGFAHLVLRSDLARLTGTGLNEVEASVRGIVEQGRYLARGWLAVHLLALGRVEEASSLWNALLPHIGSVPRHVAGWARFHVLNVDLCAGLGDRKAARELYPLLLPFADRMIGSGPHTPCGGPVALSLGRLALLLDDEVAAGRHFDAALHACVAMGALPYEVASRMEIARLALARRTPGDLRNADAQLESAMGTARRLGMAPVAEEAEALLARLRRGRATPLSVREEQLAELIAEGLSNRQIARKLQRSERTVESHVRNILIKLGFDSRARIAAWQASRTRT